MPKEVEGDLVTYTLEPNKPYFFSKEGTSNHDTEAEETLFAKAEEIGRENRVRDIKNTVEVSWDTSDFEDPEQRKKAAFDALRTWKNNVLPKLPVGTLVDNKPEGRDVGARARIYTMAGFSDVLNQYDGRQFGLVIEDENGNKRVVPVDPTEEQ